MPVTPLGFRPPELSPHTKPGLPLGAPCPPAVGRRVRLDSRASGQVRVRCCNAPCFRPRRSPLLSWAFIPSRVFYARALGPQRVPPLMALSATDSQFRLRMTSRVSIHASVGSTLSSLPTLMGSLALSSFRPTRTAFRTSPHAPTNRMKCRSVLRRVSGRSSFCGPSNVSATNPSDSHRPSRHHIKTVGGVKHYFRRNLLSYYNPRGDARKFRKKNSRPLGRGRSTIQDRSRRVNLGAGLRAVENSHRCGERKFYPAASQCLEPQWIEADRFCSTCNQAGARPVRPLEARSGAGSIAAGSRSPCAPIAAGPSPSAEPLAARTCGLVDLCIQGVVAGFG